MINSNDSDKVARGGGSNMASPFGGGDASPNIDRQKRLQVQNARQDALNRASKVPGREVEKARITFPGFNPNLKPKQEQPDLQTPMSRRHLDMGEGLAVGQEDERPFDAMEEVDLDRMDRSVGKAPVGQSALDKKSPIWKEKFKKLTENRVLQRKLEEKNSQEEEQQGKLAQAQQVASMVQQAKGDPRKVVGGLADKYLKAGRVLGTATWIVWMLLAIITSFLFVIGGLPAIIILNIMLFSPKTVYKISELILDLFGIGEFMQLADQAGLGKVDIRINQLQKAAIIVLDCIWLMCLLAGIAVFISLACAYTGTVSGVTAKGLDWWYNTQMFSQVNDFCKTVNNTDVTAVANNATSNVTTSATTGTLKGLVAWSGHDKGLVNYPLEWGSDPALKSAFESFASAWKSKTSQTLYPFQAYRAPEYTSHMRSVYEGYWLMQGNEQQAKQGTYCSGTLRYYNADMVSKLSDAQKSEITKEASIHGIGPGKTPPACNSDHEKGIAVDISINSSSRVVPSGTQYAEWISTANQVGLCHYISGDAPHFALTSKLPTGTACAVK